MREHFATLAALATAALLMLACLAFALIRSGS